MGGTSKPCLLVWLTILQFLHFAAYSTLYTVVYKYWHPDTHVTRLELSQWISVGILTSANLYFLWKSLKRRSKDTNKLKNPDELYSFTMIALMGSAIFLARLSYYAA